MIVRLTAAGLVFLAAAGGAARAAGPPLPPGRARLCRAPAPGRARRRPRPPLERARRGAREGAADDARRRPHARLLGLGGTGVPERPGRDLRPLQRAARRLVELLAG